MNGTSDRLLTASKHIMTCKAAPTLHVEKGSKESGNTISKMKLDHPTLTVRWNLPLWSWCLMILDALEHRQPTIFSIGATYLDRNQCKVLNVENVSCPTGCRGGSTNGQTNAGHYNMYMHGNTSAVPQRLQTIKATHRPKHTRTAT